MAEDWTIKLSDFGYARYKSYKNESIVSKENYYWMAPEVLRGETYEEPADVYSYGIILYEILTGKIPYQNRSFTQVRGLVGYLGEKPSIPQNVNKQLRKIVNNCLISEPKRRPGFDNIISFFEKLEKRPKYSSGNPYITNL